MKRFVLFLLAVLLFSLYTSPVSGDNHLLYKEEVEGYYRFDGQTYRWDSSREFVITDYMVWLNDTSDPNSAKFVNITMLENSQFGNLNTVTQDVKEANFVMDARLLENGSVIDIEWDMLLFRDYATKGGDPFTADERSILTRNDNQRYDLENSAEYFTYNLQYYEFHNESGVLHKYRVNTEMSSNNYEDGRTYYTALHIIKRDSDNNIIFDYNWKIYEVDDVASLLNWLDQPILLVPYKLGAVLLVIYIYMRIVKYWNDNDYRIVKGKEEEGSEGDNQSAKGEDTTGEPEQT